MITEAMKLRARQDARDSVMKSAAPELAYIPGTGSAQRRFAHAQAAVEKCDRALAAIRQHDAQLRARLGLS